MNVGSASSAGGAAKKTCPFGEKCYRRNPVHFSEMSHPHLEKLLVNQPDGAVTVPPHLDFECTDRSQLLDQLKLLQSVMNKERDKNAITNQNSPLNRELETQNTSTAASKTKDDLKEKIERYKKAAADKREAKLKELDAKAAALSKPSTINSNSGSKPQSTAAEDKVHERYGEPSRKRNNSEANDAPASKKSSEKTSDLGISAKRMNSGQDRNEPEEKKGAGGSSLIEDFSMNSTMKGRVEVRRKAIEKMRSCGHEISVVEPGDFALKYALSAPYHYFLTRVKDSKDTYNQQFSITFPEILDISLGEIASSLQINFMLDAGWLCLQYLLAAQRTDMLILYGQRVDEEKLPAKIQSINIKMPSTFGCHHSKLMVLKYTNNGIRVVVSTANLYSDDWDNRTQGVWISPHLPQLPDSANPSDGESPTGFKKDFESYLLKYRLPALTEWIYAIRRADFSAVNVVFVSSVPGNHKDVEFNSWGHRKLAAVLSKHAELPENAQQWQIVAQASSIGSLGPNYDSWLAKDIVPAMSREKKQGMKSPPNFRFIYPTINNYKQSFDMRSAACCLPYGLVTHQKQKWFESYLYQWKATGTARDRAIPHIKTYTRISPDLTQIPWLVLTSANLSKAAWGTSRNSHNILSYEAGVVFLPKFINGKTTFHIKGEPPDGSPLFPIPYDLPLTRYHADDKPFVMEFFKGYE